MLFKMDNTIVYTCIVPLIVGIFFGEIKYCHTLYVSNTKLIMRQSDQIQFLLTRIIELDKKIKKLNLDITQEEEEEKELDCLQEEKELDCLQEEEKESACLEKDFELVEPSSTYKISKNNGWLRFIF